MTMADDNDWWLMMMTDDDDWGRLLITMTDDSWQMNNDW